MMDNPERSLEFLPDAPEQLVRHRLSVVQLAVERIEAACDDMGLGPAEVLTVPAATSQPVEPEAQQQIPTPSAKNVLAITDYAMRLAAPASQERYDKKAA